MASWTRKRPSLTKDPIISDNMTQNLDNNNKRRDFNVDDFDMMKTIGTGGLTRTQLCVMIFNCYIFNYFRNLCPRVPVSRPVQSGLLRSQDPGDTRRDPTEAS